MGAHLVFMANENQDIDYTHIIGIERDISVRESVLSEPNLANINIHAKQKRIKGKMAKVNVISYTKPTITDSKRKAHQYINHFNNNRAFKFRMKPVPPTWSPNSDIFDLKLELEAIKSYYENEEEVIRHFLLHNKQALLLNEISNITNLDAFFEELALDYGRAPDEVAFEFDHSVQKRDEIPARFMARLQKLYRVSHGMQLQEQLPSVAQIDIRRKFINGVKSVEAKKRLLQDNQIPFNELASATREFAKADVVGASHILALDDAIARSNAMLNEAQQTLDANRLIMQQLVNNLGSKTNEVSFTNSINYLKCNDNQTGQECVAREKMSTLDIKHGINMGNQEKWRMFLEYRIVGLIIHLIHFRVLQKII